MAYIAATNVTVTLNPDDIDRSPDGRVGMRTFPTVQFGNAALQYTALGIPMPAIGKFGFHFAIKRAYIEQPADGFIYHFDRANHKLRIFLGAARAAITIANHVGVAPTGNVAAPANHSHGLVVAAGTKVDTIGANGATLVMDANGPVTIPGGDAANGGVANAAIAAPAFTGDASANLVHAVTGGGAVAEAALAEMDDGVAPAATTLYLEMVGR